MTRELNHFRILHSQHLLEPLPNRHQDLLARIRRPGFAALITGDRLSSGPRPHADSVEALAHVDHDAHDLVVALALERLADGGELGVQPDLVDVDRRLVAEGVGPFAAVLVLRILPFGAHALFEEVVVGFEA